MKGKLILLLVCLPVLMMGQVKVPDSDEFYFSDIYNAVVDHSPATERSFSSCVANAVDEWFDPLYKGNKDMMACFRNYPVIPCQRPTGLTTYNFQKIISIDGVNTNFSSSMELARQACYDYNAPMGRAMLLYGDLVQCASLTVGEPVFLGTTISCNAALNGYYLVHSGGINVTALDKVIRVYSGVIQSVNDGIQVGDLRGGGIVARIHQPGDQGYSATDINGLILSTEDVSSSSAWGCPSTDVSTLDDYGSGQANTTAIVATCGSGNAAWACDQYQGQGYTDWYLGSYVEMLSIGYAQDAAGLSNMVNEVYYWTSSQHSPTLAHRVKRTDSAIYESTTGKTNLYRVKAVRSF